MKLQMMIRNNCGLRIIVLQSDHWKASKIVEIPIGQGIRLWVCLLPKTCKDHHYPHSKR